MIDGPPIRLRTWCLVIGGFVAIGLVYAGFALLLDFNGRQMEVFFTTTAIAYVVGYMVGHSNARRRSK